MRQVLMYQCELCNELHETIYDAERCEALGKEPLLVKIGEEVGLKTYVGGGYGHVCTVKGTLVEIVDHGHYQSYIFETDNGYVKETEEFWDNESLSKRLTGLDCPKMVEAFRK